MTSTEYGVACSLPRRASPRSLRTRGKKKVCTSHRANWPNFTDSRAAHRSWAPVQPHQPQPQPRPPNQWPPPLTCHGRPPQRRWQSVDERGAPPGRCRPATPASQAGQAQGAPNWPPPRPRAQPKPNSSNTWRRRSRALLAHFTCHHPSVIPTRDTNLTSSAPLQPHPTKRLALHPRASRRRSLACIPAPTAAAARVALRAALCHPRCELRPCRGLALIRSRRPISARA